MNLMPYFKLYWRICGYVWRHLSTLVLLHECNTRDSFPPQTCLFTQRIKAFPYPSYLDDVFIILIRQTFPLLLVLSYIYTAIRCVF
jgi:hypothetical protein